MSPLPLRFSDAGHLSARSPSHTWAIHPLGDAAGSITGEERLQRPGPDPRRLCEYQLRQIVQ